MNTFSGSEKGFWSFSITSFHSNSPVSRGSWMNSLFSVWTFCHNSSHALSYHGISFLFHTFYSVQFSSFQSLSHVLLFVTPWTTACQASLSITNSWSSPKPMSIVSVMPSNHLILCCSLLLLPSIFPSIRVFSNESALHIGWNKY